MRNCKPSNPNVSPNARWQAGASKARRSETGYALACEPGAIVHRSLYSVRTACALCRRSVICVPVKLRKKRRVFLRFAHEALFIEYLLIRCRNACPIIAFCVRLCAVPRQPGGGVPRGARGARPIAGYAHRGGEVALLPVACHRTRRNGAGDFAVDFTHGRPGIEAGCARVACGANSLRLGTRRGTPGVRGLSAGQPAVFVHCAGTIARAWISRDAGQRPTGADRHR